MSLLTDPNCANITILLLLDGTVPSDALGDVIASALNDADIDIDIDRDSEGHQDEDSEREPEDYGED